jgi:hypothetical protein
LRVSAGKGTWVAVVLGLTVAVAVGGKVSVGGTVGRGEAVGKTVGAGVQPARRRLIEKNNMKRYFIGFICFSLVMANLVILYKCSIVFAILHIFSHILP